VAVSVAEGSVVSVRPSSAFLQEARLRLMQARAQKRRERVLFIHFSINNCDRWESGDLQKLQFLRSSLM
jgi:hypothetical protein